LPGFCEVDVGRDPPGNTQEYWVAVVLVPLKETEPPAWMVTLPAGDVIVPAGGDVEYGDSWMNCALDGTPALSSKNSM
jgi:hypothetical protein